MDALVTIVMIAVVLALTVAATYGAYRLVRGDR